MFTSSLILNSFTFQLKEKRRRTIRRLIHCFNHSLFDVLGLKHFSGFLKILKFFLIFLVFFYLRVTKDHFRVFSDTLDIN